MKRFIQGQDSSQSTLFPESLEEYIDDDNTFRAVDAYVDELGLFERAFAIRKVELDYKNRPVLTIAW